MMRILPFLHLGAILAQPSCPPVPSGFTGLPSSIWGNTSRGPPQSASITVSQFSIDTFSPLGNASTIFTSRPSTLQHTRLCVLGATGTPPSGGGTSGGAAWLAQSSGRASYFTPGPLGSQCLAFTNTTTLWSRIEAQASPPQVSILSPVASAGNQLPPSAQTPPTSVPAQPPNAPWTPNPAAAPFQCPPAVNLGTTILDPLRQGQGPLLRTQAMPGGQPAPHPPAFYSELQGVVVAIAGSWLGAVKVTEYSDGPNAPALYILGACSPFPPPPPYPAEC